MKKILFLLFLASCQNMNHLVRIDDEKIIGNSIAPPDATQFKNLIRYQDSCSGKFGFKDLEGRTIIAAKYEIAYDFNDFGLSTVWLGEKPDNWYRLDSNGNLLYKTYYYDSGPDYYKRSLSRFVGSGKVGFHDQSGNVIIGPNFDDADPFFYNHPYTYVTNNSLTGLIDIKGNILIPIEYQKIKKDKDDDTYLLKKENSCYLINFNKEIPELKNEKCNN